MNKLFKLAKQFISRNPLLFALVLILIAISIRNSHWSEWMTGWDTLHPEFNYSLNLKRTIFGVWREEQGLGTVAAHAHMADIPRILFLAVTNIFLPTKNLKLFYNLNMYWLGAIGVYFWLKTILENKNFSRELAAFIGALFYALNLITVQHFYVVFEMFSTQFGWLPWLWLLIFKNLNSTKKKNVYRDRAILFVISFLAAPMAYAPLLWYSFFGSICLFCLGWMLFSNNKLLSFKKIFLTLSIVLLANLFWILPNLFFIQDSLSSWPARSAINQLFSEEAFLQNQYYGNILDFLIGRNFLFNWQWFDGTSFSKLMQPWILHLLNPLVIPAAIFLSSLGFLGIVLTPFNKKNRLLFGFSFTILFSTFMLINQNYIFAPIFEWLRLHIDLFREGLRFPFTKFSILHVFYLSTGMGILLAFIFSKIKYVWINIVFSFLISGVIILLAWPIFSGHLFHQVMFNQIPQEYFQFYEWTETQNIQDQNILLLPILEPGGWEYHDWGYEGPGFNWFGTNNSIITRDFDRWHPNNQNLYHQLKNAISNEDEQEFKSILEQYRISYLLIDNSTFIPSSSANSQKILNLIKDWGFSLEWSQHDLLFFKHLDSSIFESSSTVELNSKTKPELYFDPRFNIFSNFVSGQTNIFPFLNISEQLIDVDENLVTISANVDTDKIIFSNQDDWAMPALYQSNQDLDQPSLITFPIIEIYQNSKIVKTISFPSIELKDTKDMIQPILLSNNTSFDTNESSTFVVSEKINQPFSISYFDKSLAIENNDSIQIDQENIFSVDIDANFWDALNIDEINIEPNEPLIIKVSAPATFVNLQTANETNCSQDKTNPMGTARLVNNKLIIHTDNFESVCIGERTNVWANLDYLYSFNSKNLSGRHLKYFFIDNVSKDLISTNITQDNGLNNILIHSTTNSNNIHFSIEKKSFGQTATSEFSNVQFNWLPITWLSKIHTMDQSNHSETLNITPKFSFNNFIYVLDSPPNQIIFNQSFHKNWIAIAKNDAGWYIPEHKQANGWSNSWTIFQNTNFVVIIFWPEILELFGFLVIIMYSTQITYKLIRK